MSNLSEPVGLLDQLRQYSDLIDESAPLQTMAASPSLSRTEPPDATSKYIVRLKTGKRGFLTVSGAGNPDLVARATRNIAAIRLRLSEPTAGPVTEPLETGVIQGYSFALWPMLANIPDGKVRSFLALRKLAPDILDWLFRLCEETQLPATPGQRQQISTNLALLHDDERNPYNIRKAAADAADRLASKKWIPLHCTQHSDLWMGNIMIAPHGSGSSFAVIDWGGAEASGFPFFDLCHLASSRNISSRLVQENLQRHLNHFELDRADVVPGVLGALGQMQSCLEFFPEDMFRKMMAETVNYSIGLATGAV